MPGKFVLFLPSTPWLKAKKVGVLNFFCSSSSTIRPIPSHQELYLSSSSSTSLLFEITERVCRPETDYEALLYHFKDIVEEGHVSHLWDTSGQIHLANFL